MIDNEDKEEFYKGVTWIFAFNLEKLKMEEFKNIIFRSHICQKPETLRLLLTTKRFNEEYLLTLDGSYDRLFKGIPSLSELETAFVQTISVEALFNLILTEAERLEVDINWSKFHVYHIKVTNELRHKFLHDDRSSFEIFALNTLRSFKQFNRLHFISLLVEDPKYAYCWTKMLHLQSDEIPEFVQQLGDQYESEADEFIKSIKERMIMPVDSVETCTILGKEYKLFMVTTPKGLKDFLQTYFIDSKPEILGIDSEAHNFKLSLFQLATKDWLCIIDIFLLSRFLSLDDWTIVFQQIFDPTIVRIGFAFHADYNFIQIAFPHLCPMLAEENRKVICLATLSKVILEDSEAKNIVFSNLEVKHPYKMFKSNVSLADVSKAVLGIKLCKDQQSSNWNWRPLTAEQKIYGITDSLIVILIKEKIEEDLKTAFGEEKTAEFLEKSNICYKKPKKEPKAKKVLQLQIAKDESIPVSDNTIVEDQEN
uniref:3'-5' exonuclease domain-containing protein n=1 Tax=Panagrolaimus superbus TaxID=310955 RepID=A0A914YTZ0_9BILA